MSELPDIAVGLTASEVGERLRTDGYNELPSDRRAGTLASLSDVLREPMFLLLLACGTIYFFLGDLQEALILLGFVFLVAGITLYQERKTEHALAALRDLTSPRALVIRDRARQRIPGREVVRGDVLVLSEGDRVAAALRGLVIYGAPGVARYRLPIGLLLAAIRFGIRPSQRNIERFAQWAFVPPEPSRRPDREWFEALLAYVLACAKLAHVRRTMRQLIQIGKRRIPDEELRRIAIPTALLWGRHDRMVPLRVAEDAHTRLGWALHVVDDVGHVPHVDCPTRFLRALRDALGPAASLDATTADTSASRVVDSGWPR